MTLEQRITHLELELRKARPSAGADTSALLKRISALESELANLKRSAPSAPKPYTPAPAPAIAKPADHLLTQQKGITDHGALTGLADNDHPQYLLTAGGTLTGHLNLTSGAGIIADGATLADYKYRFDSAANGGTWYRIALVSFATGTYAGANFNIDVTLGKGNRGQGQPFIYNYKIRIVRSGGAQDDTNMAYIEGDSTEYVQVVKTSNGVFEIQIRDTRNYWTNTVHIMPVANYGGTVTYGLATAGTGTVYSPVIANTGKFYPLTTPLTSTSFDGDSFSTTAKTEIVLATAFTGFPEYAKAISAFLTCRDSGSAGSTQFQAFFALSGNNNSGSYALRNHLQGAANDTFKDAIGIVPCNASGNVYYQCGATGTNTLDVYMTINGYWL